jgi:uncharacterized protein with PIN domain
VIYLDTSATVKLVTAEQESPALINWLNDHPDEHLATSAIGHIELIRAATRAGAAATAAARTVASTIDTLVLTDTRRDRGHHSTGRATHPRPVFRTD